MCGSQKKECEWDKILTLKVPFTVSMVRVALVTTTGARAPPHGSFGHHSALRRADSTSEVQAINIDRKHTCVNVGMLLLYSIYQVESRDSSWKTWQTDTAAQIQFERLLR